MPYVQDCTCNGCIRAQRNGEESTPGIPVSRARPDEPFSPPTLRVDTDSMGQYTMTITESRDDGVSIEVPEPSRRPEWEICGCTLVSGETWPRCRHHTERVPCSLCGERHSSYDEPPCVECRLCNDGRAYGYHPEPVCCAPIETGAVFCGSCDGTHSGPACDALEHDRCRECRNCDQVNRMVGRRERVRLRQDDYRSSSYIYNYSYVPEPLVFRGTGPLYYGMELEMEVNDLRTSISSAAEVANGQIGELGYLKEDGSINYGFEVVTHPMSYEYFVDHYPWDMLERLKSIGCRTTRGTGIHVHVSKAGFTPVHAYKWLKWWYRNQSQVEIFARRTSDQWAGFDRGERGRVKYYCKGDMNRTAEGYEAPYGPNRYSAVNVRPPNTYEVRVFRSSLSPRVARATLGLVAATVDYTREITPRAIVKDAAWEWPAFAKWAKGHSSTYPDLTREITRVTQKHLELNR